MYKKISLLAITAILAMPIAPVFAANTTMQPIKAEMQAQRQENQTQRIEVKDQIQAKKGELQAKRLEFQNNKEKLTESLCKNLETRIATRVGRYENNGTMLETVYQNMNTRLERLLTQLKTAGADTTQLEKDLATLKTKMATTKTDQATFMTTLQESQSFACGKSEGEFKGKIDQARKIPDTIKTDRENVKNFFQTTIKADLQAIRTKLAAKKATTTTAGTPAVEPVQ